MLGAATFVYVSCPDSGDIHILQFDPATGGLEARGAQMAGPQVMPLAVSPDRRCLYAALRDVQPEVASFRIDPFSGGLTEIGRIELPDSMPYIATDRLGRYLLGASFQQGTIRVHPIGPRGQVQERPVMVEHNMPTAHCIQADPSNRFVLAPVRDADMVIQRRFDEGTGMLTPNDPPAFRARHGAGPRHFEFHPNARFVYLVNELDATVDALGYDIATGRLSPIQTVRQLADDHAAEAMAADIHITPDGRFLYASERTTSVLTAWAVHADHGTLRRIGQYQTEHWPRGFRIDQAGRYLLCAGQKSASVTVYAIDQGSGALKAQSRHAVGMGACWVEMVDLP